jgi:hypothetical protein
VLDPTTTNVDAQKAALAYATKQPDYAAAWVDPSSDPSVLNPRFTSDLERHEREVRNMWGGPLCITPALHTDEELSAIRDEVATDLRPTQMTSPEPDLVGGVIQVSVWVDDARTQQRFDTRYGAGVVVLTGFLQLVS